MSKICHVGLLACALLASGCMGSWNRQAKQPSSLNTYLDQQASPAAPATTVASASGPEKHPLIQSQSDISLAKKLEARLAEAKQRQSQPQEATYEARVAALTLPEADKQQILEEFASASDAQWEELLSKLEPVFAPQTAQKTELADAQPQAAPQADTAEKPDLVQSFASKLVQRHLTDSAQQQAAVQRLPAASASDNSHLANADPASYPKTIDLERGRTPATAASAADPPEKIRRDTNVQLAAYVPETDTRDAGLYPEDIQADSLPEARRSAQSLLERKQSKRDPAAEEETIDQLSQSEYRIMQVLWQRGQVSLEALHKDLRGDKPQNSSAAPDPALLSVDELHALLFDLKGRGWIADTRRGNTVAYWALRNQPEEGPQNWNQQLEETIGQLERLAGDSRRSADERTIAQLRLRMLYLVAGRKTEALEKVEGLSSHEQEVWSNTLFGLADYMKVDEIPIDRRQTLALASFRRAMSHLEQASPLELRNLEFIQSVDSFGQFKPFPVREFRPQQEVLLYVEVDNFSSRDNNGTFETVLQSNYEIYDQAGRRVDSRQFPEVKDTCRVRRRDFYVPYRIYMPEKVEPGTYRLELTVRDPAADKFGQASIEFQIRK